MVVSDMEMIFAIVFIGTVVGCFTLGLLARYFNLFGNTKAGPLRPTDFSVSDELAKQTDIMRKEYSDRISGYRQNYKKWE